MKTIIGIVLSAFVLFGCVAPREGEVSPAQGLGMAIGYVIASPFLILAGILEGIATAPYFVQTDLHAMNRELEAADSDVTLDRTYQYAYGRRLETVPKSGSTGTVFHHLKDATAHFQNVLRGYGVEDFDRYVITAVRTADRDGYTLYSVVYRPTERIRVRDDNGQIRTLTPRNYRYYYRPYENDADGAPLDVVVDWAGVPRTTIKTQKGQAILLTLAANSVLINRRTDGYWAIQERWIAGQFNEIANARRRQLDVRMAKSS